MKGASSIDYVIAFGIFIVFLGLIMSLVTDYFAGTNKISKITVLRGEALDLLNSLEKKPVPGGWSGGPYVLGAGGKAYRFYIVVNNTALNYLNAGITAEALTRENVSFSYTRLGFSDIDINSTMIINETGGRVAYNVTNTTITFSVPVQLSEERLFTVYFDDDSNFTDYSAAVTGASNNENLTEKIYPAQEIPVIEYREIQRMQNAVYSAMKNATGIKNDFSIEIFNSETNATYVTIGADVPKRGDIVALERPVMYQNSTAHVIRGKLIVKVW